jgi:hypothetical protein
MRRDDVVESQCDDGIGHRLGSSATLTTVTFDCGSLRWLGAVTLIVDGASGIFKLVDSGSRI